jgi:acyl dehydratase
VTHALGEDFAVPVSDRWFEDYVAGAAYEYGYVTVSEPDIIQFARQWDPQPIHIDPDYAASGPFRGIIASGWHTSAIGMRLFSTHFMSHVASLASPGLDSLRWTAPLRPGDTVHARFTIRETRRSQTKPDRGLVKTTMEVLKQADQAIMRLEAVNFLAVRP